MSQPLVQHDTENSSGGQKGRFQDGKCNDVFWLLLFLVHLGLLTACGFIYGRSWENENNTSDKTKIKVIAAIIGISVAVGIAFGIFWLELVKRYASKIITLGILVSCGIIALGAIVSFALGLFFQSVVLLFIFVIHTIFFYLVRHRIPFASAVLTAASQSLHDTKGPFFVTLFMSILTVAWMAAWTFIAISVYAYMNGGLHGNKGVSAVPIIFLVLSFYWTVQVLKNVAHVTTAGVVASWWLTPSAPDMTWGSFRRAVTTSLGSICFGSLIVAILETIRFVLQRARDAAREDGNCFAMCLFCCLDCCVSCVEALVRFFNVYAYAQIAIYGYPFIEASKRTWELFSSRQGFWIVINSDLSSVALFLGCFIGGLVVGCCGGAFAYKYGVSASMSSFSLALLAFIIGFACVALILSVIDSAIATTFVLWAEDPQAMSQRDQDTDTLYFTKLVEADPRLDRET